MTASPGPRQHGGPGRASFSRAGTLVLAGIFTGIGVASMHYTGMAAMGMPAADELQPALFGLSVVIAIVAATAALWAALRLRGTWRRSWPRLIMGVAVSGMHYTGMAAMHMYPARPTAAC